MPEEFNKLSPQARRTLKFHGLDTLEKVSKLTKTDLMRLEKVGRKTVEDLEVLLDSYGLKLIDRETYRKRNRLGKLKP